jgi:hypothetical protein
MSPKATLIAMAITILVGSWIHFTRNDAAAAQAPPGDRSRSDQRFVPAKPPTVQPKRGSVPSVKHFEA